MSQPDFVDYLSVDDLLQVAAGVLGDVGVRDAGMLASAAARSSTTVFGADAYPTFAAKAAALMHSLARNHALVDGNKRLAWSATRAFSLLNGHDLRYEIDSAEVLVLQVAAGGLDVQQVAAWLGAHLVKTTS